MKKNGRGWRRWLLALSLLAPELQADVDRLSETNYAEAFAQWVVPFWKEGTEVSLQGKDGIRLHAWYRLHPAPRGQILIAHGYSESCLKYRELAHEFYQRGYSVFFLDHRGHGFSDRVGRERHAVYVAQFSDYSEDYRTFYQAMPIDPKVPTFIFAHSMGGTVAIDFLQRNQVPIRGVAFSAPLFVPQIRGVPPIVALYFSRFLAWLNGPDQFVPGGRRETPESWTFNEAGTRSEPRFLVYRKDGLEHDLRLSGPSSGWVIATLEYGPKLLEKERVARLTMPLFIGIAGDDRIVEPEPIHQFCQTAAHCTLEVFPNAYHELWNERDAIRNAFLDKVLAFYQSLEKTP